MWWSAMGERQPRLALLAAERLLEPGVVLVATVRRDGTPRLSSVEPYVMDGRLWLSMMWRSRKAEDLERDPRVLVHSIVTNRDGDGGEFKVRGRVRGEGDRDVQRRYADAVARSLGWEPEPGSFHLFSVDIGSVTFIRYDTATGDQYVVMWPPAAEFVRRATSATSVGAPESVREILIGD